VVRVCGRCAFDEDAPDFPACGPTASPLAFPARPPRPSPVTGWVLEDYGSHARRRTNTLGVNPPLLASSSETPLDGGTPRALPKQDMGSASPGVRPLAPLHRTTDRVSTPQAEAWGLTVPPACHVPSSWFLTTSTACSTRPAAGLLHPAADPGVHPRFLQCASTCRPDHRSDRSETWTRSRRPRGAVRTLQRVSLVSSRTASLRPLPSCRWHPPRG
jgi:hypothetical protein